MGNTAEAFLFSVTPQKVLHMPDIQTVAPAGEVYAPAPPEAHPEERDALINGLAKP